MSKNKIPAILKAVYALPVRQRGLTLGLLSTLCAPKEYPSAPKVLKDALKVARTRVAKAVAEMFDSSKYFVTRDGLFICLSFTMWILPAYKEPIVKRGISGIDFIDLTRRVSDKEIVDKHLGGMELARKGAFTSDQVADLIDVQWGGKSGFLLNNGFATILYMIGDDDVLYPVDVVWRSAEGRWCVRACAFDSVDRFAGDRVLRNKR